jgi:Ca-activated chloride channel family protein
MEEQMATTLRIRTAIVLLAAGLALAGCSGNSSHSAGRAGGAPAGAPIYRGDPSSDAGHGFSPEVDPADHPQSTFAMDIDTASYGYAASLIRHGSRPDPSVVRPEEFINAVPEQYPQPAGNGFTVNVDGTRLPQTHRLSNQGDVRLLRVGLQTRAQNQDGRPDAALTFVIDVSGSMGEPGKLDVVREALNDLIDRLRPTDSVAIVTFSDEATVVRPMTRVAERSDLHRAVDGLRATDSTNLEAGLVRGYQVARDGLRPGATNRVVLLSDGLANMGDTVASSILARVKENAAKQITLLGVGVGQQYGDQLMEQLADQGDGYVIYASGLDDTRAAFREQLPATIPIRALDAKVQVTFDPKAVAAYRLIGYDDRALADSAFRDDRADGGEVFAGHSVTALYTVRLKPSAGGTVAQVHTRWQDPDTHNAQETGATVSVSDLNGDFAEAVPRLQACYTAAYFAENLRQSPYANQTRLTDLASIAADAAQRTGDQSVSDLAALINQVGD